MNVVKVVDTNNEINYSYGDFTFTLNGENEYKFDNEGKYNNVNEGKAGIYTVLENVNPYYTTAYDNCAEVDVKNGEEQTCTITNTPIIPELEIIKTNNANQDKKIGDTVEYTIQLNIVKGYFVTDNSEINTQVLKEAKPSIEVFDVTPNGFKYIPGSWKGYLNDVAMDNFVLPEPTYSSPGNWKIYTDVKEVDVIKLVYSALISNEVDSGLYKDLAYAYGNTPFMTQEYAKGIGSWTNGTFVGTEVNVVNTAVQEEGVVLGVSTVELPRTGSSLILTIVALIIGVIGLLSVILGFNLKINKKLNSLILGLVTTFMLFITFGNKADAAYILRAEEPKSVTKSTFNIDYVALDTTGNTVNVKCEVIKPSTTSVIFSNKTTKVGGDSDKCEVTMAELNEGDGKYTFKVIANDDISTIQTFDVIYDTQKPLAPVSFKKTENTCSYKIEFKTANFIKIEYNLWKLTHNLMGIPLLFLSFHVILVSSDISANIPLRVVVISFIVLAVISFIYRRLFYHIFKVHEYKVSELKEHGNIIEVVLVPIGKILDFKPTQFVFVEFINNKISRELHPFIIANKNDGGSLSFFIKKLGDYTQGINKLQIGDRVKLYGPHGRFYTHFHYDKEIWVAGGIGITPFLAKLQELSENKGDVKDKQIILYYIAKTNQELIQTEKLLKYKETIPNFDVILHDTQELGRFDPKIIISKGNVGYLFCASEKLISNFKKVLLENKVKENNIHTELFKLY